MPERPKETRITDLGALVGKDVDFEFKTAATKSERESKIRREEAEAEHKLRSEANDDDHRRRINFIVHIFVMAIVAVAFSASVYVVIFKDPKTGLPDKAFGIITAIVAAGVGYMTGKSGK